MPGFITKEAAEAFDDGGTGEEKPLPRAIEALSDEVRALSVRGNGNVNRELAFVIAKLDEARLWADEFLVQRGTLLRVDKRKYIADLDATASTDSTVSTGNAERVLNV